MSGLPSIAHIASPSSLLTSTAQVKEALMQVVDLPTPVIPDELHRNPDDYRAWELFSGVLDSKSIF